MAFDVMKNNDDAVMKTAAAVSAAGLRPISLTQAQYSTVQLFCH